MDLLKTVQSPKFRSSPQNLNSKWSWNVMEVKQENQPKWLQEKDQCGVQVKCLISPSSGCFRLTLASYHPCHVNRHHGWDQLTPWAWPLRGRSAGCAAPPPPPGCSNILGAMAGGRQDQHLNVTRKIFLALGVINSCVKPCFWGKGFGVYWKLINSCSQVQQQERSLQ